MPAGCRGFRQVDETRRVGRAWGKLLLYYTLGSDPALWPAWERRERGLIMHDKGYYHSLNRAPCPTSPRPSFPSPKTPAAVTAANEVDTVLQVWQESDLVLGTLARLICFD